MQSSTGFEFFPLREWPWERAISGEVIKHYMPKTLFSFFDFNIKIATPNSTDFYLKKKMLTYMTAVTIQSNKIVLDEVKERQLSCTKTILWEKLNEHFGQANKLICT